MSINNYFNSSIFHEPSQDVANYSRLLCLLVEQGTDRIKCYVLDNLPDGEQTLEDALSARRNKFASLRRNKVISQKQFDVLYPKSHMPGKLDKYDISLWYILARNLAKNEENIDYQKHEKSPGPSLKHQKPQHDVIRIRNMRNYLFHIETPKIENEAFDLMWGAIRGALQRLGTTREAIDSYLLKDMDPVQTLNHYVNLREEIHGELTMLYKGEIKKRKQLFVGLSVVAFILILVAMIISYVMYRYTGTWQSCINSMQTKYTNDQVWGAISYMPRSGWHAVPPTEAIDPLNHPLQYVVVDHSAVSGRCMTTDDCCNIARVLQKVSIHYKFFDIAYNFLIGNDGVIYEGRGWDKMSATALHWNNISIGIGFMGLYHRSPPTDDALVAAQKFLQYMVDQGVLINNFTLYGICQIRDKFPDAPGKALYDIIKTWHGEGADNPWSWRARQGSFCSFEDESL